jgi:hypothetical protein
LLDQVDLAYVVKDDVLIIISQEGIARASKESPDLASDTQPKTKLVMNLLEKPISMSFNEDTPLEDVLKYVSASTKSDHSPGIEIYVDPKGLQEAEKSMSSTVRNLDLEGVPLKTTLRLLLKQLALGYVVKNGLLIIDSLERMQPKTKEPADGVGDDAEPKNTQDNPDSPAKYRGSGADIKTAGFVPLFNGKDLTGWTDMLPNGSEWKVIDDGVLEGRGAGQLGAPAVLVTQRQNFVNYRLSAKVRYLQDGFGWIEHRRVAVNEGVNAYVVAAGIWPTQPGVPTGSITKATEYHYGIGLGWEKHAEAIVIPVNTWSTIEITVSNKSIATSVNRGEMTEFIDDAQSYRSGAIALVCRGNAVVQYKSLMIEELPD